MSSETPVAEVMDLRRPLYRIGRIAVDSGTVAVADPAFVMMFARQQAQAGLDPWETFCERSEFGPSDPFGEPMGQAAGLHVETPHGDGVYPVYAELDELTGRPLRLVIDLDNWDAGED